MRYFIAYILLFLPGINGVFAQKVNPTLQPSFVNFTIEDGLPSNEIYHVVQDHAGYLWFATDNGICRYDGYTFKIFNTSNGLTDNAVFKFHIDHQNRLWCSTANNMLCYIENDSVFEYKYNHVITENVVARAINTSLVVDKDGTMHLGYTRTGYYRIDPEGNIFRFGETDNYSNSKSGKHVLRLSPTTLACFLYTDVRGNRPEPDSTSFFYYDPTDPDDTSTYVPIFREAMVTGSKIGMSESSLSYATHVGRDSIVAFGYDGEVHFIYPDSFFTRNLGGQDIGVLSTPNSYWLGKRSFGAKEFKLDGSTQPLQHLLDGYSISSICLDHEGGYWFSTLEGGVFYTPDVSVRSIHTAEMLTNINNFVIGATTAQLFIGYDNGIIQSVRLNESVLTYTLDTLRTLPFLTYSKADDELTIFARHSYRVKGGEIKPVGFTNRTRLFRGFVHSKHGKIVGYNFTFFLEIDSSDTIAVRNDYRILDICEYQDGMLIATDEGIFYFANGELSEIPTAHLGTNFSMPTAVIGYHDIAFIASSNGMIYRLRDGKVAPFWNHKITNFITSLETNGEWLYVGSKMGIYRLPTYLIKNNVDENRVYDGFNPEYVRDNIGVVDSSRIMQLEHLTIANGLPTNQIIALKLYNDTLWTTTSRSVTAVPLESFNYDSYPHLYLHDVKANDISIVPNDTIILTAEQNRVEFIYGGISFKQSGILYRYQLLGEDPSPIETSERIARYTSLTPGRYIFTVAASSDGVKFCEKLSCTLIILPPFWQETWFIILCIVVSITLIYLIFRWRIRISNRKSNIQRQLLELRSSALRAQMNPHFTFNALNSIQRLVASEENEKASIYLAEFSGLMRKALNASTQSMISLYDEIEIVKNYLLMEKLRFKEKFEYDLEVEADLDLAAIKVPPMIMQPFVENAIIHGLLPKKAAGHLKIMVKQMASSKLQIVVEDNGVGYDVSIQQAKLRSSNGVAITSSRVKLIHSDNSVKIETLKDEHGNSCGTRIEIILNDNL